MDKKEIRNRVRRRLKEMDEGTYLSRSALIRTRLLQEPSIIEGETIAVTISGFPEVETRHIIEAFWEMGKTVAVPKCEPGTRNMTFYAIADFSQLEKVYMGIEEPIVDRTEYVAKEQIDVMIVPGVVFDEAGYRIGFGGGYYDRYLPGFKGEKVSLAFEEQVVGSIPAASHDIPVDIILTDRKRIHARANRKGQNI
ncbi:MAG: 5-formyltetrahydrofolate cyclo-ligase [Lysinibacillus sp.]